MASNKKRRRAKKICARRDKTEKNNMTKKEATIKKIKYKLKTMNPKIKTFIALVGVVASCLAIGEQIESKKKPNISIQSDVDMDYLKETNDNFENMHLLFQKYTDPSKEYKIQDKCATQILVSNNYGHQIQINKIRLNIEDLEIDYTPVLKLSLYGDSETDEVGIDVLNLGWGDAKNLQLIFEDANGKLIDSFNTDKFQVDIPCVGVTEDVKVPLFKNTDIKKKYYSGPFNLKVTAKCDDFEPIITEDSLLGFNIYNHHVQIAGFGDSSKIAYGIPISTDFHTKNFIYEDNISEFVDAKKTLAIPICFSPNKSCRMKFKVELDINNNGKIKKISTPVVSAKFYISSIENDEATWQSHLISY